MRIQYTESEEIICSVYRPSLATRRCIMVEHLGERASYHGVYSWRENLDRHQSAMPFEVRFELAMWRASYVNVPFRPEARRTEGGGCPDPRTFDGLARRVARRRPAQSGEPRAPGAGPS